MRSGSVSVFLGMLLGMIMSLFFSMTEVVRYSCLETETKSLTTSAVQSAFGEYNRPLWDEYKLLAIDTDYGGEAKGTNLLEESVSYYVEEDFCPGENGVDFLKLDTTDCAACNTIYLTDGNGGGFIKEAAKCAELELTQEVINQLVDKCSGCKDASENEIDIEEILGNTKESLEKTEEKEEEESLEETSVESQEESLEETSVESQEEKKISTNIQRQVLPRRKYFEGEVKDESKGIIASVIELENKAVLSQVTEDINSVSEEVIKNEQLVSKRQLQQGTGQLPEVSVTERALFQYYLTKYFSCYGEDLHENGMNYEMEYILCGCSSDRENLTKTVERLLLLREVENLVSLTQDKTKVAEVKAVAAAATAVVLHPELEEIVSYGILAAWAYVESVLDVRLLLSGGKVSFLKTPKEWTSNLKEIGTCLDTTKKAKECESGITYKEYLFALYTLESQKNISYRALDVMEENIHGKENYSHVAMDHFLVEATIRLNLCATPLFLSFIPLYQGNLSNYEFVSEKKMSYL
ncbi:MAG: DUF5702 domain-containing protein [Lachnospiraceae bacterium]|nr:DUF5702 domain-containing protein [Lachnospiraceae bacterium]